MTGVEAGAPGCQALNVFDFNTSHVWIRINLQSLKNIALRNYTVRETDIYSFDLKI